MSVLVEQRYDYWLGKTNDPGAAATLVLAEVNSGGQPTPNVHAPNVLTPPQVAEQLGVDPATVICWIRSGQLKASNVGKGAQRPRYKIRQSDLDQFLKSRQPQPMVTKKRRAKQPTEIEFFA